jgi:acyl-coenzyme A thioesterase PaaI-like protein
LSDVAAAGPLDAAAGGGHVTVPRGRPENLFDLGPVLAESGSARASMLTGPWLRGGDGRLSPAGLGVLVDDVLGQAVLMKRPAGLWSVTTELNIDVAAPLPDNGQLVSATASSALIDEAGGLARGEVRDAAGRCLAVATTWARYAVGLPDEVLVPPELPADVARGECLTELLQVRICGTGLLELPPRADLGNPQGVVHGGVLLCLAVMAAEQALHDRPLEIASVRVVYLRPAVLELTFAPVIVHPGRSFGVVRVDVTNAAGALCTSATVTARSAAGPRAAAGHG